MMARPGCRSWSSSANSVSNSARSSSGDPSCPEEQSQALLAVPAEACDGGALPAAWRTKNTFVEVLESCGSCPPDSPRAHSEPGSCTWELRAAELLGDEYRGDSRRSANGTSWAGEHGSAETHGLEKEDASVPAVPGSHFQAASVTPSTPLIDNNRRTRKTLFLDHNPEQIFKVRGIRGMSFGSKESLEAYFNQYGEGQDVRNDDGGLHSRCYRCPQAAQAEADRRHAGLLSETGVPGLAKLPSTRTGAFCRQLGAPPDCAASGLGHSLGVPAASPAGPPQHPRSGGCGIAQLAPVWPAAAAACPYGTVPAAGYHSPPACPARGPLSNQGSIFRGAGEQSACQSAAVRTAGSQLLRQGPGHFASRGPVVSGEWADVAAVAPGGTVSTLMQEGQAQSRWGNETAGLSQDMTNSPCGCLPRGAGVGKPAASSQDLLHRGSTTAGPMAQQVLAGACAIPAAAAATAASQLIFHSQCQGQVSHGMQSLSDRTSGVRAEQARGRMPEDTDQLPNDTHKSCSTVSSHLRLVHEEDARRVFIVRRINPLGFQSDDVLAAHFSRFGQVKRVLVPISNVKKQYSRRADTNLRIRPGSIGFVVMVDSQSVDCILWAGREHMVAGTSIIVEPFQPNFIALHSSSSTSVGSTSISGVSPCVSDH